METWRYNTDSIISPWWNIVERRSDEHQDVFKQPDLNDFKVPGRTFGKKKDDLMHAQKANIGWFVRCIRNNYWVLDKLTEKNVKRIWVKVYLEQRQN